MASIETTPQMVGGVYARSRSNLDIVRERLKRPLTLAEKIVFGHLDDPKNQELEAGEAYLMLRPDRVAMQDATAQMALLQFMNAGKKEAAVPSTVHCDHLIQARSGAASDVEAAINENKEVYDFLRSVSSKYGVGFWKPGSGIIHQVVLENYAFPGGMMIGTDSHTPNAGGLGMAAIGVGGADAVDVMAGFPWEVLQPNLVGVHLTGEMNGWTSAKDVILYVLGQLTVKGGTNRIVEYIGPGAKSISATGKGTICNMGAELGATTSIFAHDDRIDAYLRATQRFDIAELAKKNADLCRPDEEVLADLEKFYDVVVHVDLSKLEPHVVGPHTPDLARPVSEMAAAVKENDYPEKISVSLIGSCTNSSYEDISRAADVAKQALDQGATMATPLMVTPGSELIMATISRDGQMDTLQKAGATVLANACGPCIGQWRREEIKKGEKNTIITSFNRNFPGRNDANPETLAFIASPEIVMAYGLAGTLSFNPLTDSIQKADGSSWKLEPPKPAPDLPEKGFIFAREGYLAPAENAEGMAVEIAKDSPRLSFLEDFPELKPEHYKNMPLLLKTKGKTTTDHISPAGPWLRFRGHLDKISDNMFTGAINAFNGGRGTTRNPLTGEASQSTPEVARAIKAAGQRWVVVGDENYGEGSSREHAAMSPRHLAAGAVIVRSFARIHETNLKKQGLLPLTFTDASDYEKVRETDTVTIDGIERLAPDSTLTATFHHEDGTTDTAQLEHTLNEEQVEWYRAGSALNLLRKQA
ncbi:MAG: aconitate hydratase [Candidatus Eisenbacteria bacterium]|uniref:aconitate hydratase n=1 Tax=Eiseniibacteriota bacterium TaxID=2212470 RepID=A0A7Y2E8J9_UNCEI|nr:aconitate hydratase [Candidatus Eisenbacteria bacterium]